MTQGRCDPGPDVGITVGPASVVVGVRDGGRQWTPTVGLGMAWKDSGRGGMFEINIKAQNGEKRTGQTDVLDLLRLHDVEQAAQKAGLLMVLDGAHSLAFDCLVIHRITAQPAQHPVHQYTGSRN